MLFGIEIIGFIGIGLLAGLVAGLLGLGGGVVTVPCLAIILHYLQVPNSSLMHIAIGTSLASMIFNSFSSFYFHYRKHGVIFSIVWPMAFGILIGSFLGAFISKLLPSSFLQLCFGVFLLFLSIYFLLPEKKIKKIRSLPNVLFLSGIAVFVSALSTMIGVSGGFINVPILVHYQVPMKKAIGTSAALSFFISLMGALFFLALGIHHSNFPYTFGFIYIPAFIVISIIAFFTAPWGVKLAHILPTKILRRIFGIFLFLAGLSMIIN